MNRFILLLIIFSITTISYSQQSIPLYPGEVPNSKPSPDNEKQEVENGITLISNISRPTLTIFLPEKPAMNRTAVIICPGGGYWVNAFDHEGIKVAKIFNDWGIAAFVLKYRIPSDETMISKEIGPLQDAQQAVKVVRENASQWSIDPAKIGIMGFSAGGHVASTEATHFNNAVIENPKHTSLRPDFLILIYPVISFTDSIGHVGSRDQLIGKTPSHEDIMEYSNEYHVTDETPPTFLVHASDDDVVPPANSIAFYQSLIKHKVPATLHIYEKGGHGFGLKNLTTNDQWPDRCKSWLASRGL